MLGLSEAGGLKSGISLVLDDLATSEMEKEVSSFLNDQSTTSNG